MKTYNIQDQWFEPGDKVVRVSAINPDKQLYREDRLSESPIGKVFSVESIWRDPWDGRNTMTLVGFSDIFLCHNFRKIEEIRLCVQAALQQTLNHEGSLI